MYFVNKAWLESKLSELNVTPANDDFTDSSDFRFIFINSE